MTRQKPQDSRTGYDPGCPQEAGAGGQEHHQEAGDGPQEQKGWVTGLAAAVAAGCLYTRAARKDSKYGREKKTENAPNLKLTHRDSGIWGI